MDLIRRGNRGEKGELTHPVDAFRRQMDRLFTDFFGGGWPFAGRKEASFVPNLDVAESDSAVTVKAEVPGLEEKDVEVTLSDGRLAIRGEKKSEREEKDKAYHLVERSFGSFSRVVDLGSGLDEEKAAASFKNGVLTVTIPKSEGSKPRKIRIRGA